MKLERALLVGLATAGLSLALVPGPAQSAEDTTPPTLSTPLKASFTVGRQIPIGFERYLDCGEPSTAPWDLQLDVAENFSWTGSDDSGSVVYDLVENVPSFGPVDRFLDSTQTSYSGPRLDPANVGLELGSNVTNDCGGPNQTVYSWDLTAQDSAGNSTTSKIFGGQIRLTQDNNLADSVGYAVQPLINYTGSWGLGTCTCWSQGGVHKTSAAGATATIVVPLPYSRFFDPDRVEADNTAHVGLVMRVGPNRGAFQVFVNGVRQGRVDTFSQINRSRVVVWETTVTGRSTITIVNEATPDRPRIDLDAVLTN
jgi:hypothetical protein